MTTVLEHLSGTISELLHDEPRRVLLGEDVADGGMLGLSRVALADAALRSRVLPTPLVPATMVAHAAGLAMGGQHPIVLLADAGALLEGLAGLREAATWSWRSEGVSVPLCLVAPTGPGLGLGGPASEGIEATLARIPGLRVLCAGRPDEAGAWLRAAVTLAADEGPTVLLLPRRVLLATPEGPHAHGLAREPTEAAAVRAGAEATVFTWGEALAVTLAAVEHAGIDAAVIDVGCLAPLDRDTLRAHAQATGKLVIVHAGPAAGGLGAELAADFADASILHLDAPVVRVTGASAPRTAAEEDAFVPSVARVAEAITRVARY